MIKEPHEYVTLCHNEVDAQYHDLLAKIMQQRERGDRTGTGTRSLFGHQMRFTDLANKFPLITTKKVHMKSIVYELLWMLKGDTNIKYLKDNSVTIWDEWADENGELGPVYGSQWRSWKTFNERSEEYGQKRDAIDQIKLAIESLRKNPENRRNIVSAWKVDEIPDMKLPPCHMMFQFYTRELTLQELVNNAPELFGTVDGSAEDQAEAKRIILSKGYPSRYLDCQVYLRSWDVFLGGPFNIAQYALLVHLMAKTVNMIPGELVVSSGDTHIYSNHYEQVTEQLSRSSAGESPKLTISGEAKDDPADYEYSQITLENYTSHAAIKGDVAV